MTAVAFVKCPKELLQYARSLLGKPYLWGKEDPDLGMDCSGFIRVVFHKFGLGKVMDQSSQAIHDYWVDHGMGSYNEPGALCFYGKGTKRITHVALVETTYDILEAGGGGSSTNTIEEAEKINACVRRMPFNRRKDLVAILMPDYSKIVKIDDQT